MSDYEHDFTIESLQTWANRQTPAMKIVFLHLIDSHLSKRGLSRTVADNDTKTLSFFVKPTPGNTLTDDDLATIFPLIYFQLTLAGYATPEHPPRLIASEHSPDNITMIFVPANDAHSIGGLN